MDLLLQEKGGSDTTDHEYLAKRVHPVFAEIKT
jgi:hypothetical protein